MERLAARAEARAEAQEGGEIDPAVRKKLESLGYSSGALHATIESDPFQGPDPKERIWVESAMDQAAVLYTQGRFSEAVKTLEELMAVEPGNPKIVFHLGAMNIDLGRLDRAEAYFNQLLEIQPGSAQAWTNLGVIHEKRGQGEKAEQAFRKALEADASHAEALYNLALIHARAGKGEAAVKCLAQAIEAQPNYAAAHNHLGTLLADQGDLEVAIRTARRAAEFYRRAGQKGNESMAIKYEAQHLSALDRLDDAEARYRDALTLAREADYRRIVVHSLLGLGKIAFERGQIDGAIAAASRDLDAAATQTLNALLDRRAYVSEQHGWPMDVRMVSVTTVNPVP